jgi:peptidoglycan/LPS O-acetylase OafA/YrhL
MTLPGLAWYSFENSLAVLGFGCLLTVVYIQAISNRASGILNLGILRYLGVRCYSIYLFHMLFMFIAYFLIEDLPMRFAFQIILTIGFAHISWKYIESPLIKLGQRFSYANAPS